MARHVPHLVLAPPWEGDRVVVDDAARQHLEKVLRVDGSMKVTYTDGAGRIGEGVYEVGSIHRGVEKMVSRNSQTLTVAVAPPKNVNRVRFVVEKLTEIGVDNLVWVQTAYSEGRLPRPSKVDAWVRTALEQSQGAFLPNVDGPMSLADLDRYGSVLFADKRGQPPADLGRIDDPVLCVGPEGGFADHEIPVGATRICLGSQVLRVETAAIAGAVLLLERSYPGPAPTSVTD